MKTTIAAVVLSLISTTPVLATTFVYVSNAEDGEIGMYTLRADGSLEPGQRFKAANLVMPMAVSPDKRFLIAAVRSKPYQAYSYLIDPEGMIRKSYEVSDIPVHPAEVLADLYELQNT